MASSLFPDQLRAEIRKEFGEHCMRRRDYKKANENFEASLQLQPNKLDFVYRLANSEAREANLDSALKLLSEKSKLGKTQPQNEKAFLILNSTLGRELQGSLQLQFAGMRLQLREESFRKESAACERGNSTNSE